MTKKKEVLDSSSGVPLSKHVSSSCLLYLRSESGECVAPSIKGRTREAPGPRSPAAQTQTEGVFGQRSCYKSWSSDRFGARRREKFSVSGRAVTAAVNGF
ncbi:hypothetical protein TNCV_3798071 [Trichonephila clavipes]|nr:hypothetical protein TNCV_3798071 [Trichonephila clavipes]